MRPLVGVVVALLAVASGACGGDPQAAPPVAPVVVGAVADPVALATLPDGGFLFAERRTGRVQRVAPGSAVPEAVAVVEVDSRGEQRGLVGLTVLEGSVYGAWTRRGDRRLVVGQVAPGPERLVWVGPVSTTRATGGHLVDWRGRLVVGIGDLLDPPAVADPATPNGKLLALDPRAGPEQQPEVLTGGWNNPFAFAVDVDDRIWVADNSPGDEPERFGRGDVAGAVTDLDGNRAPSALVVLGGDRFGVCGYLDGELRVLRARGGEMVEEERLARGCRTGAALAGDGSVLLADLDAIRRADLAA